MLVVDSKEELLCAFDSGRSVTLPVAQIRPAEGGVLDWDQGAFQEPRGGEALVAILPIAKMALFEYCLQVSRRGYVKKIRESFLESYIANGNVGSGVVSPADRTCSLALGSADDLLVIVSKEGSLASIPVGELPYTIQEASRLGPSDHVVAAFVLREQPSFLALTHNGKVFHREVDWLAPAEQGKSTGRAILSKARREAGMRIVGAALVGEGEWGALLTSDGALRLYQVGEMVGAGSLLGGDSGLEVLGFAAFSAHDS
jgi:DNA gyrase/topoisomerase IV subunit A